MDDEDLRAHARLYARIRALRLDALAHRDPQEAVRRIRALAGE